MKKKCFGIGLVAMVLMIFIVQACASAPIEIVYDTSIPEDQTATLFIPANIVVLMFNEERLFNGNGNRFNPIWEQRVNRATSVKIPTGSHSIGATEYDHYSNYTKYLIVAFNAIAGRTYKLGKYILSDNTNLSGGGSYTYTFMIYEMTQAGEPGPDEQLLFIKYNYNNDESIIVLDKGTVEERSFSLDWYSSPDEFRVIVPKGEHTIDFELPRSTYSRAGFKYAVEPQRHFTASAEPIRYTLERTGKWVTETKIVTLTRN